MSQDIGKDRPDVKAEGVAGIDAWLAAAEPSSPQL